MICKSSCAITLIFFTSKSPVTNTEPSPYINDILGYLTSMTESTLSSVPAQLKGFIYAGVFELLSHYYNVN